MRPYLHQQIRAFSNKLVSLIRVFQILSESRISETSTVFRWFDLRISETTKKCGFADTQIRWFAALGSRASRSQSFEKYKNLCSQACEYKHFWKTLVFTCFVKFNPMMPVLTCKYKLLKYNKLKIASQRYNEHITKICKSFIQALWLVKSSFLVKKFTVWFGR